MTLERKFIQQLCRNQTGFPRVQDCTCQSSIPDDDAFPYGMWSPTSRYDHQKQKAKKKKGIHRSFQHCIKNFCKKDKSVRDEEQQQQCTGSKKEIALACTPPGSHPAWSSLRKKPSRSKSPWPVHHVRHVVVFCVNNAAVEAAWENLTLFQCIGMQCISLLICGELQRHAQIFFNFFVDSCCSWWKSTATRLASVRKLLGATPVFWSVLCTVLLDACRVASDGSCGIRIVSATLCSVKIATLPWFSSEVPLSTALHWCCYFLCCRHHCIPFPHRDEPSISQGYLRSLSLSLSLSDCILHCQLCILNELWFFKFFSSSSCISCHCCWEVTTWSTNICKLLAFLSVVLLGDDQLQHELHHSVIYSYFPEIINTFKL